MRYKRGDPAAWILGIAVDLASGVYFPVTLLPRPFAIAAAQLPTTSALNTWRMILLEGIIPPTPVLVAQCLWAVALFGCGWYVFGILFDSARRNATVGNY
jgi:ABC-type polysaccharide/polyol phosphate export permease